MCQVLYLSLNVRKKIMRGVTALIRDRNLATIGTRAPPMKLQALPTITSVPNHGLRIDKIKLGSEKKQFFSPTQQYTVVIHWTFLFTNIDWTSFGHSARLVLCFLHYPFMNAPFASCMIFHRLSDCLLRTTSRVDRPRAFPFPQRPSRGESGRTKCDKALPSRGAFNHPAMASTTRFFIFVAPKRSASSVFETWSDVSFGKNRDQSNTYPKRLSQADLKT